jgi:hypothetical protein
MTDREIYRKWGEWPSVLFAAIVLRKEYAKYVKLYELTGFMKLLFDLVTYYKTVEDYRKCFKVQTLQIGIKCEIMNKTNNPKLKNELDKITYQPRFS